MPHPNSLPYYTLKHCLYWLIESLIKDISLVKKVWMEKQQLLLPAKLRNIFVHLWFMI